MVKKKKKGLKTAVISHRGGCGKTYTVHMLTSILSSQGKKVLVIDACSTSAITNRLLPQSVIDRPQDLKTLYTALVNYPKVHWTDVCYESDKYKNVFVIPSDYGLGDEIAPALRRVSPKDSTKALSIILAGVEDSFDHIIFDCNNGIHQFNQSVLDWADQYINPTNKTCEGIASAMDIDDLAVDMGLDMKKAHIGMLVCGMPNRKDGQKEFFAKLSSYKRKILGKSPVCDKIDDLANQKKTLFDDKKYKYHPVTKVYKTIVEKYFS